MGKRNRSSSSSGSSSSSSDSSSHKRKKRREEKDKRGKEKKSKKDKKKKKEKEKKHDAATTSSVAADPSLLVGFAAVGARRPNPTMTPSVAMAFLPPTQVPPLMPLPLHSAALAKPLAVAMPNAPPPPPGTGFRPAPPPKVHVGPYIPAISVGGINVNSGGAGVASQSDGSERPSAAGIGGVVLKSRDEREREAAALLAAAQAAGHSNDSDDEQQGEEEDELDRAGGGLGDDPCLAFWQRLAVEKAEDKAACGKTEGQEEDDGGGNFFTKSDDGGSGEAKDPLAAAATERQGEEHQEDTREAAAEDDEAAFARLMAVASKAAAAPRLLGIANPPPLETQCDKDDKLELKMSAGGGQLILIGDAASAGLLDEEEDAAAAAYERTAEAKGNETENAEKMKRLRVVDHSLENYEPFEKNFFILPDDEKKLTADEVKQLRQDLDGAHVWGTDVPPPIRTWEGIGLSDGILQALSELRFKAPFSVQAQAMPVLMSGRDLIAIAQTGSGKTLAYLLPMLRHVVHQRRCVAAEGPIGLILVPTHELADQVFKVCKQFAHAAGKLRLCAAYGGTNPKESIASCKRGCDIMVATPGRLLDLLVSNTRCLSFRRVTFVVLDETDRMLDSGFGPLVEAFLRNIRPDRQLCMVSSTMPKEVKQVAKAFLHRPVELSIGGRPSPSHNVTQHVEVFQEPSATAAEAEGNPQLRFVPVDSDKDPRWLRLLQILGEQDVDQRLIMVFVGVRNDCVEMASRLALVGYGGKVGTLYSGMEQFDREMALKRLNKKDRPILICTDVAERGIDIPELELVINYACPSHYESYVNRIGRTGRAGRKGTAYTFFTEGRDDAMAPELVGALEGAGLDIPDDLRRIALAVGAAGKSGALVVGRRPTNSFARGFRNARSYKFTQSREARETERARDGAGLGDDLDSNDDLDSDDEVHRRRRDPQIVQVEKNASDLSAALVVHTGEAAALNAQAQARIREALQYAQNLTTQHERVEALKATGVDIVPDANSTFLQAEYEINDISPEQARRRLHSRKLLDDIQAATDTSIYVKGRYVNESNRGSLLSNSAPLQPGERKMFLLIRGNTEQSIREVFRRLDEVVHEAKLKAARIASSFGKVRLD